MHFYYMDEAGCTGNDLSNAEQPIFVLGGVSVRDEGWNETQQLLASIVDGYFDPGQYNLPRQERIRRSENLVLQNRKQSKLGGVSCWKIRQIS